MANLMFEDQRELRHLLQDSVDLQDQVGEIPLALAQALCATEVDKSVKLAGLGLIRDWTDYANKHQVPSDPYATRYHLSQFAAEAFGEHRTTETLQSVSFAELRSKGQSYVDILSARVSPAILSDPDVAIVGGAARVALKMHAGVDIASELPISDIDAVTTVQVDVAAKAATYGIDLAGMKIVDSDVRSVLDKLATNFDCTMNQAAVHDNQLLFSQRALKDIQEGNIRLIAKNDPLFGSEGVVLPDGETYLNRAGFYRGLSFLLRNKGDRLIVSQENIEREKDNIGRYWQIMLLVKLAPMPDESARYRAIGQWHELAQRMGSTTTSNALEFLDKLTEQYPSTNAGKQQLPNPEVQARWIIKRLVNEAVKHLSEPETFVPPATYTPANLTLAQEFADYDYPALMNKLDKD